MAESSVAREALITCPLCGAQARETMPENACRHLYRCNGCGEMLRPKPGDCCVFCSYADTLCPPKAASRENVELVRAGWEEFNRTGRPALSLFDPEIEWHTRVDLPDAGSRKGHEGIVRLAAEWVEAFEDFHVEVDELIEGGPCVIVVLRLCGRPRGGSQEIEVREAQVWTLSDGRAVEVRAYLTRAEAVQAAGLTE